MITMSRNYLVTEILPDRVLLCFSLTFCSHPPSTQYHSQCHTPEVICLLHPGLVNIRALSMCITWHHIWRQSLLYSAILTQSIDTRVHTAQGGMTWHWREGLWGTLTLYENPDLVWEHSPCMRTLTLYENPDLVWERWPSMRTLTFYEKVIMYFIE